MGLERLRRETNDDGRVVSIELPGGRFDRRTALELRAELGEIAEDRHVSVVILTTAGTDWCTARADDLDPVELAPDPATALARVRVPTIAVLGGAVRSVGLEIALAADLRIAGDDVRLALPDVVEGAFPCWGGTQRLARVTRPSLATELVLLGREVAADEALAAGLVHEVVPAPFARAGELADRLLGVGQLASELAKEAVHRGSEMPLAAGLRLEGDLNHLLAATEDRAEGIRAFLEKRPPDFAGR